MSTAIYLHLGTVSSHRRIDAQAFNSVIQSYLGLLKQVDRAAAQGQFQWYVTDVAFGSATIELLADWPQGVEVPAEHDLELLRTVVVDRVFAGVEQLESGEGRPDVFSPAALRAIERLGNAVDGEIREIKMWRSGKPGHELQFTKKAAARASQLLNEKSTVFGSVEGQIITLSLRKDGFFSIYDEEMECTIQCSLPKGAHTQIREAFGERVIVQGEIEYAVDRKPLRVTRLVNWWIDDAPATPIEDLIGAFEDFTDGLPAEDFLNQEADEHPD